MPIKIHGKSYKTVAERVNEFRSLEDYVGWSISTKIVSWDRPDVVIKAIIKNAAEQVVATGLAHEVEGSTNINKTSFIENCETSAVGRALAALGLAGTEYASGDEVSTAIIQQAVKGAVEGLIKHNDAVRLNMQVILAIKEALADEDYESAAMLFCEMDRDALDALWVAPTKGGIFTTKEIADLKGDPMGAARKEYVKSKGEGK